MLNDTQIKQCRQHNGDGFIDIPKLLKTQEQETAKEITQMYTDYMKLTRIEFFAKYNFTEVKYFEGYIQQRYGVE